MNDVIRVGIADMNTCMAGDTITTIGLGSCVGIVLYERTKNIAGLVHIMLPDSTKIRQNQNKLKQIVLQTRLHDNEVKMQEAVQWNQSMKALQHDLNNHIAVIASYIERAIQTRH